MLLSDDNPFSIYSIKMCCDGKYLIAAGRGGHVTLFKFTGSELEKADEGLGDLSCLEIPIFHRNLSSNHDDLNSTSNSSILNDLQAIAIKQNLEKKVQTFILKNRSFTVLESFLGIQKFTSSKNGLSKNGWLST